MDPAVKGTLNVLEACLEANMKRVVVVSSTGAVTKNPSWPEDQPMDETSWSDAQYCTTKKLWYHIAKTKAEIAALEFGKKTGLDVLSVCPTFVTGPMLQHDVNVSSLIVPQLLKGQDILSHAFWTTVDVRDVAEALLLVYKKPESKGRYICSSHRIKVQDLVEMLRKTYPSYNFVTSFADGIELRELDSDKLQRLGWTYRSLEVSIIDSIENLKQRGILE